jgi:DNA polymerase delta subunit 1
MYSLCPPGRTFDELNQDSYIQSLKAELNEEVKNKSTTEWQRRENVIVDIVIERKTPFWGLHLEPVLVFKYTLNEPKSVPFVRQIIVDGVISSLPKKCFNADIDFTWRCMIDQGFSMSQWIRISSGHYTISPLMAQYAEIDESEIDVLLPRGNNISYAARRKRQMFASARTDANQGISVVDVHCTLCSMIPMTAPEKKTQIAPMRILTTDIECAGRPGTFPEAEKDPVICIGNLVNVKGAGEKLAAEVRSRAIRVDKLNPRVKEDSKKLTQMERAAAFSEGAYVIMHLRKINPDKMPTDRECYMFAFDTEEELLLGYSSFIRWLRPEIVLSWNGHSFDFPYLIQRARHLGIEEEFCNTGDVRHPWRIVKSSFSNKAYAERSGYEVIYPGTTFYDVMLVDQREVKRRSYTLNSVAADVVGKTKEDLHYSLITPRFNGTVDEWTSVCSYCLIDCARTFEVCYALLYIGRYLALSSVSGCSLYILMARGVIARSYMMVCRKAEQLGYVVDFKPKAAASAKKKRAEGNQADFEMMMLDDDDDDGGGDDDDEKYEGAHVFRTLSGYYFLLATLDFASLYPSIMQAYNLCVSSEITAEQVANFRAEDVNYFEDTNTYYVKTSVREGIIPIVERELVAVRRETKKAMAKSAEEGDYELSENLDGLQLAQKLLGNGLYGYCGTPHKMPNKNVAANVTSVGQKLIKLAAKRAIEILSGETPWGTFPNAFIAAGDTDSIMICFDKKEVKFEVDFGLQIGRWLAEQITREYPPPVSLEFEKVYAPAVLVAMKRYAGVWWTKPTAYDKIDSKGMESKRRDNSIWEYKTIVAVQDEILVGGGVDAAVKHAQEAVRAIYTHQVPLDNLITTAQLSRSAEKYKTVPAQVIANNEIKSREGEGAAFKTGDRVPYIVVPGPPRSKKGERARYSEYVRKEGLYGDVPYYLKRLGKSLARFLDPLTQVGFTEKNILNGPHTLRRVLTNSSSGPMAKFLVPLGQ